MDTALAYQNEAEVGQGIKDSGIARKDIWLTTKLDNTWHHRVEEAIDQSLKDLGTDYVDLYLIVYPTSPFPLMNGPLTPLALALLDRPQGHLQTPPRLGLHQDLARNAKTPRYRQGP